MGGISEAAGIFLGRASREDVETKDGNQLVIEAGELSLPKKYVGDGKTMMVAREASVDKKVGGWEIDGGALLGGTRGGKSARSGQGTYLSGLF